MRKLENHWSITSLVHNSKLFLICSANQFQRLFSHIKKITVGIIFTLVSLLKHLKRGSQIFWVCLFICLFLGFFLQLIVYRGILVEKTWQSSKRQEWLATFENHEVADCLGTTLKKQKPLQKAGPSKRVPKFASMAPCLPDVSI